MDAMQTMSNAQLLQRLAGAEASLLSERPLAELFGLWSAPEVREAEPHALSQVLECLAVARELFARALTEKLQTQPVCLTTPADVTGLLRLRLGGLEHETFWCLWLDAANRAIVVEELFRGTLSRSAVYPREVVKAALRHNARSVILAHNHPSGQVEASPADRHLTDALRQALALIDVQVLDHVIVGRDQCLSFAERGWLSGSGR